ncbi:hypothetical protein BZA77DRAFT_39851 [Pyronema omphalodes]|nr:hypothetical protein BZA77DRAFT_39851 [Pyronema omphalodes]
MNWLAGWFGNFCWFVGWLVGWLDIVGWLRRLVVCCPTDWTLTNYGCGREAQKSLEPWNWDTRRFFRTDGARVDGFLR